jgi:hypothetical protein
VRAIRKVLPRESGRSVRAVHVADDTLSVIDDEGLSQIHLRTGKTRTIVKRSVRHGVFGPAGPVLSTYDEIFRKQGARRAFDGSLAGSDRHLLGVTHEHLHVLDPATLEDVRVLDAPGHAVAVAGDVAAVAGSQGIVLVDLRDGTIERIRSGGADSVALSPDAARIVFGADSLVWEGPIHGEYKPHSERGNLRHGGAWFAIGNTLLDERGPFAVAGSEIVGILPGAEEVIVLVEHALLFAGVRALEHDPARPGTRGELFRVAADDQAIAGLDDHGNVTVWDAGTRAPLVTFPVGTRDNPIALRGDHLFVGRNGVDVWDWRARRRLDVWARGLSHVRALRVRGRDLVVAAHDRAVVLDDAGRERASAGPWKRKDQDWNLNVEDADLGAGDVLLVAREEWYAPAVRIDLARGAERELVKARRVVCCEGGEALLSGGSGTFLLPDLRDEKSEPVPIEIPRLDQAERLAGGVVWAQGPFVGTFFGGVVVEPTQVRDQIRDVAASGDRIVTAAEQWAALRANPDASLLHVLPAGASGHVRALAFDATGERLAVGEDKPRLHIWQLAGIPERVACLDLTTLGPDHPTLDANAVQGFSALAFPEQGITALSGRHLRWSDPRAVAAKPDSDIEVKGGRALSRDGARILAQYCEIRLTTEDGRELLCLPELPGHRSRISLSPDGRFVLTAEVDDATNLTVHADDGTVVGRMRISAEIDHVALDPSGGAVGWIQDGPCFRWEPSRRTLVRWGPKKGLGDGIAFGKETCLLWYSTGLAFVLETRSGRVIATLPAPLGTYVETGAISPDGALVALGDRTGATHLFRTKDAAWLASFSGTADGGHWSVSPAGTRSAVGEAVLRVWRAPDE